MQRLKEGKKESRDPFCSGKNEESCQLVKDTLRRQGLDQAFFGNNVPILRVGTFLARLRVRSKRHGAT